MKILISTLLLSLFSLPVLADGITPTEVILSALEDGGIDYVYATPSESLIILRTKSTSKNVDSIVESGVLTNVTVDVEIVNLLESFESDASSL